MPNNIPSESELVLFRKRKEPALGIFKELRGQKLVIFSEEAKEIEVDLEKVVLCTGIKIEQGQTQSEKKLRLRELRRELEEEKQNHDLRTLWECFSSDEEGGEIKFQDLKALYFPDNDTGNKEFTRFFWAVDKDDIYFKRGESGYIARSSEDVQDLLRKKEAEARKNEERRLALIWGRAVVHGKPQDSEEEFDPSDYVELITNYIIYLDNYSRAQEAKSYLSEIGIRDVEGAIEFLVGIGKWDENEDPIFKRFSIKEEFPKKVEGETAEILDKSICEDELEDLRHLRIFSVDDENTEDIDDALSIEETDEGFKVGVHIANVAYWVRKWSDLDNEAARRGETVYLPEKRIHMFPPELIRAKFSLIEGEDRVALSLILNFDKELNLKSFSFKNALVHTEKNISYEQAVEYFENDTLGRKLREIALSLRCKRLDAGAFIIQLPQLKIKVSGDLEITVEKNFMNTEAHRVVAEMMILMNTTAGKYLRDNTLPGIYRSQPEHIPEDARTYDTKDPLYALSVVKYLRAPRVGLDPEPHRSLGLDVYTQVTSPIRRYTDLVMQRQIMSHLTSGEYTYAEDELENLYPRIEIGVRDKRAVERSRVRFWLYKHFEDIQGKELPGIVSSISGSRASVYLPDYLMEFPVTISTKDLLEAGKGIKVRIDSVDPLRRRLSLSEKRT
jgi:exoribonuclease II